MRGGETGGEAGPSAATPVPEKAIKSLPAHNGGCFTCAFDRSGYHKPFAQPMLQEGGCVCAGLRGQGGSRADGGVAAVVGPGE